MRRFVVTALVCFLGVACGKPSGGENSDVPDAGSDAADDAAEASDDAGPDAAPDLPPPSCEPVFLGPDDEPFETLAEYCLFGGDTAAQEPADGVVPFEPIAVLYADESLKQRFIALPEGAKISFDPMERFTFGEGTVLVKTFYFWHDATDPSQGRRLLETRLLIKRSGEWEPFIYVWNEDQTEATYRRLGDWIEMERIDDDGESQSTTYRVPKENQCASCHEQSDAVVPLGPRAFQLSKGYDYGGDVGSRNQLERWAELGMFDAELPDTSELFTLTDYVDETAELDARARSYLEVNCAHCHGAEGAADPSGLKLSVTITEPAEYGVCRRPVAAGAGSGGLFYDIVPGEPENSIMIFRMSSTDPEIKMPELPTRTADDFGVRLISEWISAMEPAGCPQ